MAPARLLADEARQTEHLQVLRDSRAAEFEACRELTGRLRAGPKGVE